MSDFHNRDNSPRKGRHRLGDLSLMLDQVPFLPEAHSVPFAFEGNVPGTSVPRSSIYQVGGTLLNRDLNRKVEINVPSFELGVAWGAIAKMPDIHQEHTIGSLILSYLDEDQEAMWDYFALVQRQHPRGAVPCEAELTVCYPEEDFLPGWLSLKFYISEENLFTEAGACRVLDSVNGLHRYVSLLGLSDVLDVLVKQDEDADLTDLLRVSFDGELIPESVDAVETFRKLLPANYPISLLFNGRSPSLEFLPHKTIFRVPTLFASEERSEQIQNAMQECRLAWEAVNMAIEVDVSHKWSEPPIEKRSSPASPLDNFLHEQLSKKLGYLPSEDDIRSLREFFNTGSEKELTEKFEALFDRLPTEPELKRMLEITDKLSEEQQAEPLGKLIAEYLESLDSDISQETAPIRGVGPHHYRGNYFELELYHGDSNVALRVRARQMLINFLYAFREHLGVPRYLQKLAFKERFQGSK